MDGYIKIEDAAIAFSFHSPYRYEDCLNALTSSIADGTIELADVAPVVHSKWELTGENHTGPAKCKNCGFKTYDGGSYCLSCGAKMDKEA